MPDRSAWFRAAAFALPLVSGAVAVAQERPRDWIVVVSPYVWAGSLHGDAGLAGFSSVVDVPFSDVLDTLDFALMGSVEATNGLYGGFLDGYHVRTSQEEHLAIGELGLDIRTTSVSVGGFYRVHDQLLGGDTVFGRPRRFGLEPMAGLRWTKQRADLTSTIGGGSVSESWTDPFIGLRLNADLDARWNVVASVDIGGTGSDSSSHQAQAYLGYRAFLGGQPVVWRFGYRALSQDHRTTDFTGNTYRWDVTQRGPVLGISLQF